MTAIKNTNMFPDDENGSNQNETNKGFLYLVSKNGKAIPGGFIIKARKIDDSEIAHAAPCIREIWDWLLRQCNHKDNPAIGIKRGQCVRRLADMMEGLHWYVGYRKMTYSKSQCEHACEWLRERGMITTAKTTRGMLITVCNYDSYNSIENYEANSEKAAKATRRQQQADTINNNDNNDNKSINVLFDSFWNSYNLKKGKPKAESAFNRLSQSDRKAALEGIEPYLQSLSDMKYQKHPATYLNQRTWEDENIKVGTTVTLYEKPPEQDLDTFFDRPKVKLPWDDEL